MTMPLGRLGNWIRRHLEPPPSGPAAAPLAPVRAGGPDEPARPAAAANLAPSAVPVAALPGEANRRAAEEEPPETVVPPRPAKLPPVLKFQAKAAPRAVLAVTVLGLGGDSLEEVLTLAERESRHQGLQPLFITDQSDLEPFRRRRLIVDQVIDAERRAIDLPELPWRLYLRAQYALMGRRWQPEALVSFGRPPEAECVEALQRLDG
jgi:hypothetical protein